MIFFIHSRWPLDRPAVPRRRREPRWRRPKLGGATCGQSVARTVDSAKSPMSTGPAQALSPAGSVSKGQAHLARIPIRSVRAGASGPALIKTLGQTGRLQLAFGIAFAIGLAIHL